MKSLFTPLKAEVLTTLKINYNYLTGTVRYFAAKEWDEKLDFSQYNKTFYAESILSDDARYLNTREVEQLFKNHGLLNYLEEVVDLIKKGKHFGMECYFHEKCDIRFMCNIHSRKLGVNNRYHATMAGGIRRHGFDEEELEVIVDGLNLGRAMSFKNIAASIDFGGCKTTVHMEPLDLENMEMMGFLAFAIDRCRTMTGPDMNFPTEMADVMNANFSVQYTNGPSSPIGESGRPTAYGVYLALKQAVRFRKGTESLAGMSVALQGLGAVGWYMAEHLLSEDIKLIVTDVDESRVDKLIGQYPGKDIIKVNTKDILSVEADIFCPCAIGGIIHEGNIPELRFDYIFGPANNQLRATSQEEEIRLAKMLDKRGILFQTEWWHNAAGVLCGAEHYLCGDEARYEDVVEKTEKIIPANTWKNLNLAKELGITPAECVYRTCQDRIYGEE